MPEVEKKELKSLTWDQVEDYVNEKSKGGAAMAVIETEKIFGEVLKKLNFPGKNTDQRVDGAKNIFSNYQALKLARSVYKKLAFEVGTEIEIPDVREILSAYHRAIRDLTKAQEKKLSPKEKVLMFIRHYAPEPKKTLKKVGVGLILFFFIIFVLDSTSIGKSLVSALVKISHFIFSWVLFTVLLIIGIVIIIIGGILYFESRKRKTKLRVENK
jgi:hypothetical protein